MGLTKLAQSLRVKDASESGGSSKNSTASASHRLHRSSKDSSFSLTSRLSRRLRLLRAASFMSSLASCCTASCPLRLVSALPWGNRCGRRNEGMRARFREEMSTCRSTKDLVMLLLRCRPRLASSSAKADSMRTKLCSRETESTTSTRYLGGMGERGEERRQQLRVRPCIVAYSL